MAEPNPKTVLRKKFYALMGEKLARLGLPAKADGHLFFKNKTELGYIGVHLSPITRRDGLDFVVRCAISAASVQMLNEKTELYDSPTGLSWTCGALLKEIWRLSGGKYEIPSDVNAESEMAFLHWKLAEHGSDDGFIGLQDSDARIEFVAERIFARISQFGWPLLQTFGQTEETFLDLILRSDRVTELLFLGPVKPLAGLILAQRLDRPEARKQILDDAQRKFEGYAKHGSTDIHDQFVRIATQLALL